LDVKFFTEVFVTLFVIMDPPGTIPLFLSLTSGRSKQARKRMAWQAVLVAFFVITTFALFGQSILDYLGITLAAMQVAGGVPALRHRGPADRRGSDGIRAGRLIGG